MAPVPRRSSAGDGARKPPARPSIQRGPRSTSPSTVPVGVPDVDRAAWEDQQVQFLADVPRPWRARHAGVPVLEDVRLFAPGRGAAPLLRGGRADHDRHRSLTSLTSHSSSASPPRNSPATRAAQASIAAKSRKSPPFPERRIRCANQPLAPSSRQPPKVAWPRTPSSVIARRTPRTGGMSPEPATEAERAAAEEPQRPLRERAAVAAHEAPGVLVPAAGVQRAADHDRAVGRQVGDGSGRAGLRRQAVLAQEGRDGLRDLCRGSVRGPVGDQHGARHGHMPPLTVRAASRRPRRAGPAPHGCRRRRGGRSACRPRRPRRRSGRSWRRRSRSRSCVPYGR
ncbi:hypothetical protein EDD90_9959 [Streptomyces sp. Ag109_O5-1]|nr:hypothetical protein EDD90_9959 [Streptomyces sp. Ag109_O5-1]